MKKNKLAGMILLTLMSISGYTQCDFKTFMNTYFDVYEANDSLVELGMSANIPHKKQIDKKDKFYDCAVIYFPSQSFSLYSCHINNYYIIMFWTDRSIDGDYDIDDNVLVLCNERGEILDRYIHRKIVRAYLASYRYYLQKDTLIWRYWKEDFSDSYSEQQFKIIKDKIVPL